MLLQCLDEKLSWGWGKGDGLVYSWINFKLSFAIICATDLFLHLCLLGAKIRSHMHKGDFHCVGRF